MDVRRLYGLPTQFLFLGIIIVLISSCRNSEPTLYKGTAYVKVTDGEINDTLRTCYCWQTKDSLNLHITRGPFFGIDVDITGRKNVFRTSVGYYSDTNEFDGEFNIKIPVKSDSINISFQNIRDSVRISGYIEAKSEPVKFYEDRRVVQASGTFDCTLSYKD